MPTTLSPICISHYRRFKFILFLFDYVFVKMFHKRLTNRFHFSFLPDNWWFFWQWVEQNRVFKTSLHTLFILYFNLNESDPPMLHLCICAWFASWFLSNIITKTSWNSLREWERVLPKDGGADAFLFRFHIFQWTTLMCVNVSLIRASIIIIIERKRNEKKHQRKEKKNNI